MPRQARTAQDLLKDLARNKTDHAEELADYWKGPESTEDLFEKKEDIDAREAAGEIDAASARGERAALEEKARVAAKIQASAFTRGRAAALFAIFGALATAGWTYAFVNTSGLAAVGMGLVWVAALFPAAAMFVASLACGLAVNAGRLLTARAPVWNAFFPFSAEAEARRVERGLAGGKNTNNHEAKRAAAWHRTMSFVGAHRYAWVACFAIAMSPAMFGVGARYYAHNGVDIVTVIPSAESARTAFSDPQSAQALAQRAAQSAKQALDTATAHQRAAATSWLQEQAIAATPSVSSAQIVRTVPAYFGGVFRPAGLWVVPPRGNDPRLADFVAEDSWFVPFYTNASCRSLPQDAAVRDEMWLRDHTLTLPSENTLRRQSRETLARRMMPPEPAIHCVGEPILVHRKEVLAPNGRRSYGMSFLKRGFLIDLNDWSDTFAALRVHPSLLLRALHLRFERLVEDLKDLEKV